MTAAFASVANRKAFGTYRAIGAYELGAAIDLVEADDGTELAVITLDSVTKTAKSLEQLRDVLRGLGAKLL